MADPAVPAVTLAVRGPIERTDLPGLYSRVCALLTGNPGSVVHCDVAGVEPDAATVDALARLQLAAQRHGCQVRLGDASEELVELVAFMGLGDALAVTLRVEPRRQPEQGKQRLGSQEERELADPALAQLEHL